MAEKYVPKQIQQFVDAALALARNDSIGYCQWENGQDLMCTGFVSKALQQAGMPSYSNIHAAQPVNENGWKTYPFEASKVWPGDILITQGKHAGVAVGWGGPVAEAVTSGPRPTAYTTFTDVKTKNDYKYAVKLSGAGNYNFDFGKSDYYQVQTAKVAYDSYQTGGYPYYQLKTFPYSTISESEYYGLSLADRAKYQEKYEPLVTHYKYGTLTYYKLHGSDFWPEPEDQGGEVIEDGSASEGDRTHIIRYIKAWLGIDHFEPNFSGNVKKIP